MAENKYDQDGRPARNPLSVTGGEGAPGKRPESDGRPATGACPGNTHPQNSQTIPLIFSPEEATVAIDWIETAGVVHWTSAADDSFVKIAEAQRKAEMADAPSSLMLGGKTCLVHPRGMGNGKQSRMNYRVQCGEITIGLSPRREASRQLQNFYLKITGTACLLEGGIESHAWAKSVVAEIGGVFRDEWFRRLDICLDLPNVDLTDELLPAYLEERFVTTARLPKLYGIPSSATGFTFETKRRVRINVYDKLQQTLEKKPADYQFGMLNLRWNGSLPKTATRIEVQIERDWFAKWEDDGTEWILENRRSVLSEILDSDNRDFFRMLATKPDRKNSHQNRCETLPLWDRIRRTLIERSGEWTLPLARSKRKEINSRRLWLQIRGLLATTAAIRGTPLENLADAFEQLQFLQAANDGTDDEWREVWERKAKKMGTIDPDTEFYPDENNSAA